MLRVAVAPGAISWKGPYDCLASRGLAAPGRASASGVRYQCGLSRLALPLSAAALQLWSRRAAGGRGPRRRRRRQRGLPPLRSAVRRRSNAQDGPGLGVEGLGPLAPSRWDGAGLARGSTTAQLSCAGDQSTITLRPDIKVGDATKALLVSNVVCIDSDGEKSFFVKLAPTAATEDDGGGIKSEPFCILLEDLLEAPRGAPLECLVSDSNEECELYSDLPEPYISREPVAELLSRMPWLVALLLFLTVSSAILEFFDGVLQRHLIIAFYLTALIGCGGNSGSQASSLVLQALATGELRPTAADALRVCQKELTVGLGAAAALAICVFLRMVLFGSPVEDGVIISLAMAVTVLFSVLFGALTPLALQRAGFDPAKVSGPLLSTTIDIFGVLAACVSAELLERVGYLK